METIISLFTTHPGAAWALLGAVLIALEVTVAPGIGFLFGGLSALSVGILITTGVVPPASPLTIQIAYFFGLTCVWALALWLPLKGRWRKNKSRGFGDMVGASAVVEGADLVFGKTGKVRWSGVSMKARIARESIAKKIPKGEEVYIIGTQGNVLFVQPTSIPMPSGDALKEYRKTLNLD